MLIDRDECPHPQLTPAMVINEARDRIVVDASRSIGNGRLQIDALFSMMFLRRDLQNENNL